MPDGGDLVAAGGVQHDGANVVDNGVLLHVQQEKAVHDTLKKFPQNTDGHGEAEGHDGHEHRGEGQGKPLVAVEQVHQ